ncbi:MAG TPA: hypothetical protein VGJ29_19605 [Vicinamibacterales bacterium]
MSRRLMRTVLKCRAHLLHEFRPWLEGRCRLKGAAHAVAQRAARRDIRAAHRTGLEVAQNLVVRLGEEFLSEKRIGQFTNVAAFHV